MADLPLLAQVVKHKETFYPAWPRYDLARPGTFHLVPAKERMEALERDYKSMAAMIFGEPPSFDAHHGRAAMIAGYAIGWLTKRFDAPFERLK